MPITRHVIFTRDAQATIFRLRRACMTDEQIGALLDVRAEDVATVQKPVQAPEPCRRPHKPHTACTSSMRGKS